MVNQVLHCLGIPSNKDLLCHFACVSVQDFNSFKDKDVVDHVVQEPLEIRIFIHQGFFFDTVHFLKHLNISYAMTYILELYL